MSPFTALSGLSAGRQLLAAILGPLIPLVLGLAGGVAWEHRGPQRFPLAIAGDSLSVQRDKARFDTTFWRGRAVYWHGFYGDWKRAAEACDSARDQDAATAGKAVETDTASRFKAADQSFTSGYAAGRVAGVLEGRKACGAKDDAQGSDPADPLGDLVGGGLFDPDEAGPGGVRDWNAGAYRPGG